ncbi:MAG: hypothetical protein V3W44_08490 [Dehalococcoidales bacterium]
MCQKQSKTLEENRAEYLKLYGYPPDYYPELEKIGVHILECTCKEPVGDGFMVEVRGPALKFIQGHL